MNSDDRFFTPEVILDWFVARASYGFTGTPLEWDVISVRELLETDTEMIKKQMEWAERGVTEESHNMTRWGILGIYPTYEEASASLDWVIAWARGS